MSFRATSPSGRRRTMAAAFAFRALSLLPAALITLCFLSLTSGLEVSHDGRALLIDGERKILISGAIHYPRSTAEMWPDLMKKAKLGGLDAIETYIFWDQHEPRQREYNFEGNLDIVRFFKEVQNAGLYAVLRIGPYVCAEWNYGGFPAWLRQIPGMELRTDNQPYKEEMQNFATLIVDMIKKEKLLAPQGGPIILAQIENEYGNIEGPYGDAGKRYIKWCAEMAVSQQIGVPWVMCQQADAPQPMINTCNGFYCDNFKPTNPGSPKMWTENWTGWFKKWDLADPHRPAEDVAFAVARFFQSGGSFQNYYMYHGGTNFGRTSGGPYITTTYDYDAPLDEYGNLRLPKWGHLKELHSAIKMMEKALTHGDVKQTDLGQGAAATKYSANGTAPGCFLSNTNTTTDVTVTFEGNQYFLPAWSVSILPDCKNEVYNTAKVTTQTHIMVKKPEPCETEDEPSPSLAWSWWPETLKDNLKGKPDLVSPKLLEQITTTVDVSDYLWHSTSVHVEVDCWKPTIHVNTSGHVLHVFINGQLVGSQYGTSDAYAFNFEQKVDLKKGTNHITLLSATVGLKNYGSHFELEPAGILGPVYFSGDRGETINITNNWTYKIGLSGEKKGLFKVNCGEEEASHTWRTDYIPTLRPFTWYKTTFQAPLGDEPVVVDMLGMGKGEAWVNGKSIGRFWANYTSVSSPACMACDYRGTYSPSKCQTACGEPGQRWYHIPRSFIKSGVPNSLVLFEEAGGNPLNLKFQTVTTGIACGHVSAGKKLVLSCQGGRTITGIKFASFGDPEGTCGAGFKKGSCESREALAAIQEACVGQPSCEIEAGEEKLGSCGCGEDSEKRLAVQATC